MIQVKTVKIVIQINSNFEMYVYHDSAMMTQDESQIEAQQMSQDEDEEDDDDDHDSESSQSHFGEGGEGDNDEGMNRIDSQESLFKEFQ